MHLESESPKYAVTMVLEYDYPHLPEENLNPDTWNENLIWMVQSLDLPIFTRDFWESFNCTSNQNPDYLLLPFYAGNGWE